MKQRGFYLFALSLTLLLIYVTALIVQNDFQYEQRKPLELHALAFGALFNVLIHFAYWSARQRDQRVQTLDTIEEPLPSPREDSKVPGVFPNLLFPLGFLLNLGGVTYLLMFIADHWSAGRQIWMQHWFPLIFLTLAGIITFIYGTLSFLKAIRPAQFDS